MNWPSKLPGPAWGSWHGLSGGHLPHFEDEQIE